MNASLAQASPCAISCDLWSGLKSLDLVPLEPPQGLTFPGAAPDYEEITLRELQERTTPLRSIILAVSGASVTGHSGFIPGHSSSTDYIRLCVQGRASLCPPVDSELRQVLYFVSLGCRELRAAQADFRGHRIAHENMRAEQAPAGP